MVAHDKTWHNSISDEESSVSEFELQLWRAFNAFIRWVEECEHSVNGTNLTGYELSILHIMQLKDKPKSISDVGRILNRTDNYNLQYSIRKLLKLGLIQKVQSKPGYSKSTAYELTEEGRGNTKIYAETRRNVLINTYIKNSNISLEEMTKTISQLKMIYDDAAQAAAIYVEETVAE